MRSPRKARSRAAVAFAGTAALSVLALATWTTPRDSVPLWLGSLVFTGACLLASAWLLRDRRGGLDVRWVLGVAAALRLAALAAPVSLSDDVYRYEWDGTLIVSGEDPFARRPDAVVGELGFLSRDLERLNSPHYYSVYPPLSQATFALGGLARRAGLDGTRVIRAALVVAELFGVFALVGLLRRLDRPPGWALLYAWNPLVAWEVAGGGHTEALMLPFLLYGVIAVLDRRAGRAGMLLGLAIAAKLTAALALPLLALHLSSRDGWRQGLLFAGAAVGTTCLAIAPFWSAHLLPHVGESLRLYSETFSFNAPVYYAARWMMGYEEGVTPPVDAALVPWLTGATCLAVALFAVASRRSARGLVAGLAWTFAAHLLLSRVMHPWYLLPVLALAAAGRRPALLALGSLSALSYLRYHPLGHEAAWVLAAQAVPFAALSLVELAGAFPSAVRAPSEHPVTNPTCPRTQSRLDYAACRSRPSTSVSPSSSRS